MTVIREDKNGSLKALPNEDPAYILKNVMFLCVCVFQACAFVGQFTVHCNRDMHVSVVLCLSSLPSHTLMSYEISYESITDV